MSLRTNTKLPAAPQPLCHGRKKGEGFPTVLPNPFRHWRTILLGNPAAIKLHQQARFESECLRAVQQAIAKAKKPDGVMTLHELYLMQSIHNRQCNARPADGGASTSLAQPVPYSQLHGETGEGFETLRRRFDLPSSVTVVLALGFILPVLIFAIVKHGGFG